MDSMLITFESDYVEVTTICGKYGTTFQLTYDLFNILTVEGLMNYQSHTKRYKKVDYMKLMGADQCLK